MSNTQIFGDQLDDILLRPLELPAAMATDATWMYPVWGVYYFLQHPELWSFAFSIVVPQIVITTAVFIAVHVWFYPPQAIVAVFFNGPTGFLTSWLAILHQSGIISRLIIEQTILPGPLRSIFDKVVKQNGSDQLIAKTLFLEVEEQKRKEAAAAQLDAARSQMNWVTYQMSRVGVTRNNVQRLVSECQFYISSPYYWLKAFVIVFFNLIPFFGPYILVFLRSPSKARSLHARYYAIRQMDKDQVHTFFNAHRALYTNFGLVALNLELVPVVGMFFTYTNIVAAALWATRLEKSIEKAAQENKM